MKQRHKIQRINFFKKPVSFLLVSIICAHRRIMQKKIINHESKYKLEVQMRCRVSNQLTNQIHGHQVKSSDMKKILTLFHL